MLRYSARVKLCSCEPTLPWEHERILPVVIGCGHKLYVRSGADLQTGADGAPVRTYLKDAWKRTAASKWEKMPELPTAVMAPSGVCGVNGHSIVFSGDDGALAARVQVLRDKHPGFSLSAHELIPSTEKWHEVSRLPVNLVRTWRGVLRDCRRGTAAGPSFRQTFQTGR